MNQACFAVPFTTRDPSKLSSLDKDLTFDDVTDFLQNRKGPLSSLYAAATAYFVSSRARKSDTRPAWPDIRLVYSYSNEDEPERAGQCLVSNTRPLSRGTIKYNASSLGMLDPNAVILDFKYYTEPTDFYVVYEGTLFKQ